MAYTEKNYKTAKAMLEDLKMGKVIHVYQPGPFGPAIHDGTTYLEGPHYPEVHRWYARVEVKNGQVVKVFR